MSIPNEGGAPGVAEAAAGDPHGTGLISQLVKEFYSAAPVGPVAPSVPTPTVPTTVTRISANAPAGPTNPPSAPNAIPSVPSDGPGEPGLAGGYPSVSSGTPPVHPVLESAEPVAAPKAEGTRSGAHDPNCQDSHPFGEPRCNGTVFNRPNAATTSSGPKPSLASSKPSVTDTSSALALPGYEAVVAPEYYFLRGGDTAVKPSLPGVQPGSNPSLSVLDIEAIRRDFPALHQRVNGRPLIWLDNAATTHKPQNVIDATSRFYGRDNSNIHRAAHALSERATAHFEAGREKVRQFLGAADAKEIVFVRGTTEAINLVAQSYGRKNIGAGDEIVITEMEHHANIVPWQLLAQQTGANLRIAPFDDQGELILEEFVKLLGPRTKFVSVTHVSNALGTINPVEQIIALAHARGVPVLVDGAQSTPHLPVNVTALDADFYVFSGHKVFGPTGIGALYGKAPLLEAMPPWQGGGHMIQDVRFEKTVFRNAPEKFEAGTPDIAGVIGLGAAIDYLFQIGIPAIAGYEHALLEYATHALSTVPGLRPIGTAKNKASVLSFVISGISNESIAKQLDKQGIAVRAGHHCAQPAIRHFGLETSVRPSLAFYNNHADVDVLVNALHQLPRK